MNHLTTYKFREYSIKNPTLVHFRHFSSLFINWSKLSTILDLFMQNKANFQKVKFYVTNEMKKDYEKRTLGVMRKTKPNKANSKPIQSQFAECQNERN